MVTGVHNDDEPAIEPGVEGTAVSAVMIFDDTALEPQLLLAFTANVPVLYLLVKLSVMEVEVDVPVAPGGNVHV